MGSIIGTPEIGRWYRHLDKGEVFQVVSVDDDSGTVEVQSFGGDLDEIDADTWDTLPLAFAAPPEDWSGPMDELERDHLGYSDTESIPTNWTQPPEPLGIEAWDDTRNDTVIEIADESEDAASQPIDSLERPLPNNTPP